MIYICRERERDWVSIQPVVSHITSEHIKKAIANTETVLISKGDFVDMGCTCLLPQFVATFYCCCCCCCQSPLFLNLSIRKSAINISSCLFLILFHSFLAFAQLTTPLTKLFYLDTTRLPAQSLPLQLYISFISSSISLISFVLYHSCTLIPTIALSHTHTHILMQSFIWLCKCTYIYIVKWFLYLLFCIIPFSVIANSLYRVLLLT